MHCLVRIIGGAILQYAGSKPASFSEGTIAYDSRFNYSGKRWQLVKHAPMPSLENVSLVSLRAKLMNVNAAS